MIGYWQVYYVQVRNRVRVSVSVTVYSAVYRVKVKNHSVNLY